LPGMGTHVQKMPALWQFQRAPVVGSQVWNIADTHVALTLPLPRMR